MDYIFTLLLICFTHIGLCLFAYFGIQTLISLFVDLDSSNDIWLFITPDYNFRSVITVMFSSILSTIWFERGYFIFGTYCFLPAISILLYLRFKKT